MGRGNPTGDLNLRIAAFEKQNNWCEQTVCLNSSIPQSPFVIENNSALFSEVWASKVFFSSRICNMSKDDEVKCRIHST